MFSKETIKLFVFISLAALFAGIFLSSADFIKTPVSGWKDFFIILMQWSILLAAIWCAIYALVLNKYVFMLAFPLINAVAATLAYFRFTANAVLTTMIVDATLNNDVHTSADLISSGLIVFVLLIFILSIGFVIYRFKKITIKKPLIQTVSAFAIFLLFMQIPQFKRPVSERIPFNIYFITKRYYIEKAVIMTDRPSLSEGIICPSPEDSVTVVLIIGESLRADHLGINGYKRNTTPLLQQEDIISFPNIYSEYTYTNESLPHFLTRADSLNEDRAYHERSFIDLYNTCGFYSAWLANQESADTYVYFMHECKNLEYVNIEKSPYVFDQWLDEALLPLFDKALDSVQYAKKLFIMHTIGSHWYYNSHFPEEYKKYTPITKSRIISASTPDELINSYDNTVLYTDFFIHSVINRLRDRNAIMIYLSDHGESLGENNTWLHAVDSYPIHNPACMVWMSPTYKKAHPEMYDKALQNQKQHFRTDFIFPSMLDAANIGSPLLEPELSIFR